MRGANDNQDPLDIAAVLSHYGANWIASGSGWRNTRCPFHDDRQASASINRDIGAFKCHGCEAKGDALGVIAWKENIGRLDAAERYQEITGESARGISSRTRRKSSPRISIGTQDYERGNDLFGPRLRR